MAKSTKSSKAAKEPASITVRYDLHDLPTAQHKAGLAGLLLQIESMNDRRERGAKLLSPPRVVARGPTFAELEFTAETTQALFDDLYAATWEEAAVAAKWPGKEPKAIRDVEVKSKDGKLKIEKRFVYDVVQPSGPFLAPYTDGGKERWHKLWRDMLWTVTRGRPTTRGPFNARADGKPTGEGADAWADLVANEKARAKGGVRTIEVAGAVLLGAQAVSAESVPFLDRADHALLLHFWQLTAGVFVPEHIDADGSRVFAGYVLAIPDVSDLLEFMDFFKRGLGELTTKSRGYRPTDAVISVAAEGSLAFMHQLDRLAAAKALGRRPPAYLSGVEFFHMVKLGNNIKTAANGRIPARDGLLNQYDGLMSSGGPRNQIMLAGRLRALLQNAPWFAELAHDLVKREWSWFVHSAKEGHRTPAAMLGFARDARRRFEQLSNQENNVSQASRADVVDRVIYKLVKNYVREKASARMGVSTADREAWHKATHDPTTGYERPAYQEERRHVAQGLFLTLRSRHEADFVEQFTAMLGSVAQRLPEDEYAALAAALMLPFTAEQDETRPRTRDDVKTLTLLACSAHSRSLTVAADEESQPTSDEGN